MRLLYYEKFSVSTKTFGKLFSVVVKGTGLFDYKNHTVWTVVHHGGHTMADRSKATFFDEERLNFLRGD